MNFKIVFVASLLLGCLLEGLDAKKRGKTKDGKLAKGKSGRPKLRSSKLARGSVQGIIDAPETTLVRCQFLERNFGEGAAGVQIRKCKVKRPYKKKIDLICEYGDFLCGRCEMARCSSYKKNKKVFLFQLGKKILAGIKQDPITQEFYCSGEPVLHSEDTCRLNIPFSSNYVTRKPKTIAPKTTATTTTEAATTDPTTTVTSHPNCEDDPSQVLCNTFMSWGNFIFNRPFQN